MKKLKVYLDSSIISHLFADDVPEKMRITKEFWEEINNYAYEAIISQLVYAELNRCAEP
jgi:predicted nucleic acid-binding protein